MEHEDRKISFKNEIRRLISMRQEGGYWDFKRQWHEKKSDLLHDIICMANNLHNRAAYIIIGIDENQNYEVVDIRADTNRRNTQNVVDFLKDKKFSGGIRPLVHVEQVLLYQGIVDVIVIENSRNTPFYLTEQYEGVRANHIYTRVMDTNTPKDRSADINNIEYLWRKRFHMDETPLEKFCYYLQKTNDWQPIQDDNMGSFYKYAPEYTISSEHDESRNGYEYYIFGQTDNRPSWWLITLRYHQTAIEQFLGIALDGGRSFVVAPSRAYELHDVGISCVGFYVKDSLRWRLLTFYHEKETVEEHAYTKYMCTVLVFDSEYEHTVFVQYVKTHLSQYQALYEQLDDNRLPYFPNIGYLIMDTYKKEYKDVLVLQEMLTEFRNTVDLTMEESTYADS